MTVTTSSSENKINNDDIDLALDALRNCDTDFIKFDEVSKTIKEKRVVFITTLIPFLPPEENMSNLLLFAADNQGCRNKG